MRFLRFGLIGLLPFFGCSLPYSPIQDIQERTELERAELQRKDNIETKASESEKQEQVKQEDKKNEEGKFLEPYLGFNALEFLAARNKGTDETDLRNRLYAGFGLKAGPLNLNYSSTNDINELDHATYFGRHVPAIGLRDGNQLLAAVVKTTDREILDTKVGVRDLWIPGKIGYGYLDVSFDENAGNTTFLFGRNFGEKFFVELYNETEVEYNNPEDIMQYNEIQPGYKISDKIDITARIEAAEFDFDKAIYMLGFRVNIP